MSTREASDAQAYSTYSILLFAIFYAFRARSMRGGGSSAPTNSGGSGGGSGTDDVDDGSVSETYSIEVGLYNTDVDLDDLENSTEVSSVSSFGSAFFVARVTDTATSEPVAGAIVSMTTSAGGVSPAQVLTNSNGVTATRVTADDASLSGAATLTATFSDVSQSLNFSFGSVDLQLGRDSNDFVDPGDIAFVDGEIDISATGNLSAGGTTVLRVVVVSDNNQTEAFTSPLTIEFTSDCAAAEVDTNVTTANGIAVATFRANSCEGDINITANVAELTGVSATTSVFVESADVGSINFVSSDPTQITLKGTGNDTSEVTFRVLTELGDPAVGETVTGVLSSIIGGITIGGDASVASGDLPITRVFRISDIFNGPLPSGTTFNVATTNCVIGGPTTYATPDSISIGSQAFAVALAADETPSTGLVTLTVEVPGSAGGVVATRSFSCSD